MHPTRSASRTAAPWRLCGEVLSCPLPSASRAPHRGPVRPRDAAAGQRPPTHAGPRQVGGSPLQSGPPKTDCRPAASGSTAPECPTKMQPFPGRFFFGQLRRDPSTAYSPPGCGHGSYMRQCYAPFQLTMDRRGRQKPSNQSSVVTVSRDFYARQCAPPHKVT